jgi:putative membrane protein
MTGFLARLFINALAMFAVAYFVPGVYVDGPLHALVAAVILGFVNAIVGPILILISLPLEIVTLGFFTIIINGFTFWLVAHMGIGLQVNSFGSAVIGSIVLSVISFILSQIAKPVPA